MIIKKISLLLFVSILGYAFSSAAQDLRCNHFTAGHILALEQRTCLMRALKNNNPSSNMMALTYRSFIQSHSEVGYDLVWNWDRYLQNPMTKLADEMENMANKADQLMLKKDFNKAYDLYLEIENRIKIMPDRLRRANLHFRLFNLHSMARALYGAGDYQKAFTVYSWIPPVYPNYRQVLFEQMWTTFNMGRIDVSLGTLASQRSSYFGKYLEPESYLVWIYILRKLCRNNEINLVRTILKNYEADLNSGRYAVYDWAKSDAIAQSWATMIKAAANQKDLDSESKAELNRLEKLLRGRFAIEKKRLLEQIEKINKFSYLALDAKAKAFPPTKETRSYTGLLKIGFEMWPGADAEDWFDEVGRHRFVGESRCQ